MEPIIKTPTNRTPNLWNPTCKHSRGPHDVVANMTTGFARMGLKPAIHKNPCPEGPSTQYFRTLVPNTTPLMGFGTSPSILGSRTLWVLFTLKAQSI